jgi:gluconate kinase
MSRGKPLNDTDRAILRTQVTRALLERPRGEGLPLTTAAKLLKQADRAGMTLEEWIALFNLRA